MSKPILILGLVVIGLAVAVGALGMRAASPEDGPELVAARAERERAAAEAERARAAVVWAEANEAQAKAEREWQTTLANQAWADTSAHWAAELRRWAWVGATGAALAVAAVALAGAWWVWGQARIRAEVAVINAPSGPILTWRHGAALYVLDTARSLGPLSVLSPDGADYLIGTSEAHTTLAGQALAAGVIRDVSKRGEALDVAERAGAALKSLMGALPLPGFGAGSSGGEEVRAVTRQEQRESAAERDNADFAEFVRLGAGLGFARSKWIGAQFQTGNRCTRARWEQFSNKLKAAGLTRLEGGQEILAWPVAETLARLGLPGLPTEDAPVVAAQQTPAADDTESDDDDDGVTFTPGRSTAFGKPKAGYKLTTVK